MPETAELKARLETLAAQEFAPPAGPQAFELAQVMLRHVGDPDPRLRDELIYSGLARWIMDDVFTPDQMRQILQTALDDEHLFYRLGESGTPSVFTRAFSALLLPPLLIVHRRSPYLAAGEVRQVLTRLLAYLPAEIDRRGYVRSLGWAHAVAHAADALDDLAQCAELETADLQAILQTIAAAVATDLAPYNHEEDERLAYATLAVLRRGGVPPAWLSAWVQGFVAPAQTRAAFPERHYRFLNIRNYLRSLYFQARKAGLAADLQAELLDVLDQISHF